MEPEIISQLPMTLAELQEEIMKLKAAEKEPSVRITRMEDYLNSVVGLKKEDAGKLKEKITKLDINRLKEEHVCKIVDILPKTADELKLLMQGYSVSLTGDASQKIVDAVNEFLAKK